MKLSIKKLCLLTLILIGFTKSHGLKSQNLQKKDSLVNALEKEELTNDERARLLRYVANCHPNFSEGLRYAKQSYSLALEIGSPMRQAEALEEISHLERLLGNNDKSFEASLQALQIYEKEELPARQAASYTQLASNYISDADYQPAILYLKEALLIYDKEDNAIDYASTLLNLGETYRLNHQLDSAAIAFDNTLALNESLNNDIIESYALGNLGMVHAALGKNTLAKEALSAAITKLGPIGDAYSTSVYLAELGSVYQKENNPSLAESNYLQALEVATSEQLKEQIRDISGKLRSYYEGNSDFEKALTHQKTYQIYQDSLVNKQNVQKIEQLKAGYEIDKRETEIGLLNTINKNQRTSLILLALGLILLLSLAYILYRSRKVIAQREKEKALLLSELNHRVKNNLQMISSLLNLQSRQLSGHPGKEALQASQQRVEALSLVHRKLYQEGISTKVPLKEYIEELVVGLFHGYDIDFTPQFTIPNTKLSIDSAIPLALIVNELVINSLKYAYETEPNPSLHINMSYLQPGILHVDYKDNGKGFDLESVKAENSFGINIITTMVRQLNGTIEKSPEQGTHWQFTLRTR